MFHCVIRKELYGFLFLCMRVVPFSIIKGLRLAALRAAGAPLILECGNARLNECSGLKKVIGFRFLSPLGYICRYRKALYFGSLGISLYLELFCFLSIISFGLRKLT